MAGKLSLEREARLSRGDRGCRVCGVSSHPTSETLGLCLNCIRTHPDEALRLAQLLHAENRRAFDLPAATPQAIGGLQCVLCSRQCRMAEGEHGYCGLRAVRDGRLTQLAGIARRGILQWYRFPCQPTAWRIGCAAAASSWVITTLPTSMPAAPSTASSARIGTSAKSLSYRPPESALNN